MKSAVPGDGCPFCSVPGARTWLQNEHVLAFRDGYPVSEGHTLVIPKKHLASIFDSDAVVHRALWEMVAKVRMLLGEELGVSAFNVGVNDGVAAGQTVMHGHVHVIPRTPGDVADPRGGVRWVVPENANYWEDR